MIPHASIPDALKPPEMRGKHHMIAGPGNALYNRKITVCPPFLKAQVDQRRAFNEMMVSTRNVMSQPLSIMIRDNDGMPVLLFAGSRGLDAIPHDIFSGFRRDGAAVKVAAGRPAGQLC